MGIMEKSFRNRKEEEDDDEDKDVDEDEIVEKRQRIFFSIQTEPFTHIMSNFIFISLYFFSNIAYNTDMTQYFPLFSQGRLQKKVSRQKKPRLCR